MTNYEKLKQLSIEDLAILLDCESRCDFCIYKNKDCGDTYCEDAIKKWLNRKATT